ncbi:MAG TPA: hypothetical protein VIE63_04485 [Ramlibacter sp.]
MRASPRVPVVLAYRLRRWPERLPDALRTAGVLRALSVMSSRPVSREWIDRHANLRTAAVDELLELLVARGELDVVDTSKFAPSS